MNSARSCSKRDGAKRLHGRIEIDDACIGGERPGGKRGRGRGAAGKTPSVAAVETTPEGKPVRMKRRRVAGFRSASIAAFAKQSLGPACAVVSDGLACFAAVRDSGCSHMIVRTGSGPKAAKAPAFNRVNTALGNIKAAIAGTYRSVSPPPKACAAMPRRVRIPLQQALRSCRHHPAPDLGQRPNPAHAISPAETG